MTLAQLLELAFGAALITAAIWLLRRPADSDGKRDSQGAVLCLVIGAIAVIHGLGLLEYHPLEGEGIRRR